MLGLLGWVLGAGMLLVAGLVVSLFARTFDWRLWFVIRRARRAVMKVARRHVPTAGAFSIQGETAISAQNVDFWITTATDKERDLLCEAPETYRQFCDALLQVGYPHDAVTGVHFRIQSQETVDREYGGSWAEATQMP
jgi:hypothetical protein